jgi:hypothetical protein
MVRTFLKQFLFQIEIITGVKLSNPAETQTLIWVLLQTLINNGTLASRTIRTAKEKTEVFIRGLLISEYRYGLASLKLFIRPARLFYIHNILYLRSHHYTTIQTVIRPNKATKKHSQFTDLTFIETRLCLHLFINWRLLRKIIQVAGTYYGVDFTNAKTFYNKLKYLRQTL